MRAPLHLMTQPATLVKSTDATSTDEYGNADATTADVAVKVALMPRQATEVTDRSSEQTERWDVFLPPGLAAGGNDYLIVGTDRYHFEGAPTEWRHPRTLAGVYAQGIARKVTG